MKSIEAINTDVTVIGLGQMGTTLASLLLKSGYTVTIWNRTKSKGEILIKDGAKWAENIAAAIQASDTIVICVFDYAATRDILYTEDVTASLAGKTIIQLTTGSPTDAIESEAWAQQHGAYYIDGAIQVAPEQMGKSNTTIFISGQQKTFSTSKTILNVFGGNIKYLGEKISAASAMDLASLSYLYGSLLGFFHAVRISEVEGFSANLLGEVIREITPGFAEFIQYEASVIQLDNFNITQSPLSISVEATARILRSSREYKINTELAELAASFLKRAKEAGYENEELASLIKIFRA
jgi:3-hydroxyisobutyrate dehydrogenase-like beta-hydroxyacid dehydrogenase